MNSNDHRAKAIAFRNLHQGPKILVLPNAWDCVSARFFEQAGFPAIATTSGGIAAVLGNPDGQRISSREMLAIVVRIAGTVSVPVTADLEAGYGTTTEQVAETMRQAIAVGVVGANLEDGSGANHRLVDLAYQVEVICVLALEGIGPETIDTIPLETLAAYRDHGKPASRLSQDGVQAAGTLRRLSEAGIDLDAVTQQLEDEGVQKFIKAFDVLMNTLKEKRVAAIREPVSGLGINRAGASN